MNKLTKNINGNEYELRPANFFEAKQHFTKLLGLAKNAISFKDNKPDIDIGQLLTNIGSNDFNSIEMFVLKYASVMVNGKEILLKNEVDAGDFFNKNRGDYVLLIIEGLKYHFLGFLPDTMQFLVDIPSLIAETK